jgi:DNA-binding transcriptional regulator YiaG
VTLAARDTGNGHHPGQSARVPRPPEQRPDGDRPVEFWPTSAIRSALETGDITVWQRIVVAIKRDPYGRTARQVEEVLEHAEPLGISKALSEVLVRSRQHLEANERAEAARHVRLLLDRSGLSQQEFASRIGVPAENLATFLEGGVSPPASLMIRMRRLSDRFAKMRAHRPHPAG